MNLIRYWSTQYSLFRHLPSTDISVALNKEHCRQYPPLEGEKREHNHKLCITQHEAIEEKNDNNMTLLPDDIVIGNYGPFLSHPGNMRLNNMVLDRLDGWNKITAQNSGKKQYVNSIIEKMETRGRFVLRKENNLRWPHKTVSMKL